MLIYFFFFFLVSAGLLPSPKLMPVVLRLSQLYRRTWRPGASPSRSAKILRVISTSLSQQTMTTATLLLPRKNSLPQPMLRFNGWKNRFLSRRQELFSRTILVRPAEHHVLHRLQKLQHTGCYFQRSPSNRDVHGEMVSNATTFIKYRQYQSWCIQ